MKPKSDAGIPSSSLSGSDEEHYIWITEFDDGALTEFYKKFTELEHNPKVDVITLLISSYGGEAYVMLAMRDLIKSCPKPVATIALGKAMSSGAFLLAAGSKGLRFASPDTAIMIHEVAAGVIGKTAEISETADTIKALNCKVIANLATDCNKSYKYIEAFLYSKKNADMMMTSAEAKRMGLIDNIGIPRIAVASMPTQLVHMSSHPAHVGSKRKKAKKP